VYGGELEADLPSAGELDIDLRKQLGVEQCAVAHAVAAVDAVAGAQRVERMLGAGMPPPSDRQGVDHPFERNLGMAAGAELAIEEAEIELRVVRDERRIGEKFEQIERAFVEARLVGKERVAEAVDLLGFHRHRPVRVEIGVEGAAGGHAIDQLDAADLDHSVARPGVEPGGFGIEYDLPHRIDYRTPRARWQGRDHSPWSFSTRARTSHSVSASDCPVSITKSAWVRFSSSGSCKARISANRSGVMPSRASTRAR
jgi:hypothetical protein